MQRLFSEAEQGSTQWKIDRIGYVSASEMDKVMAKGKGVTRYNYMVKILCESLSGQPQIGFKSDYMQNGNDNEAPARLAYEFATGHTVEQKGFCYIPELMLGASTDGIVNEDGLIEIKNVKPGVQVDFILNKKIDSGYIKQMQTQMFVLEKKWCDFVSYSLGGEEDGELPTEYKLKIVRVDRDEKMIEEILNETKQFHKELAELKDALQKEIK